MNTINTDDLAVRVKAAQAILRGHPVMYGMTVRGGTVIVDSPHAVIAGNTHLLPEAGQ